MVERMPVWVIMALAIAMIATSCEPRSAPGEVKLALIAPFEGEGRPLGYKALCGVKLAMKEHGYEIAYHGPFVSLIALNDNNDPKEAQEQLLAAEEDRAVLIVLGPWRRATANAVVNAPPKVTVLIPAPVEASSTYAHRFFADDESLRGAISSATGGKCADVISDDTGYLSTIQRCSNSDILVIDGDSPRIVKDACKRIQSGKDYILSGPDFVRPWTLPILPSGVRLQWFTSWEAPPKRFEEKYGRFCNDSPSYASFAAYKSAAFALKAVDKAYQDHNLSRAGVNDEISKLIAEMQFPVTVHTLTR